MKIFKKKKRKTSKLFSGKLAKPKNKRRLLFAAIIFIVLFASVKNVVRLEMEHHKLQKQNKELKATRRELQLELKNANSKEYIEEQARKQLRLVNPDEILFVFPSDKDSKDDDNGNE